ncbi:MAG: hypothetical protein DRN15_11520, partial [Thermoprotei archaeon]
AKGLINGFTIYPNPTKFNLRKREKKQTYWNALQEIARDADWDFYVDNGGTLVAFPRGLHTYNGIIRPDFRARIEYDDSRIINSITVQGRSAITKGSDSQYTESDWSTYWSGDNVQEETSTVRAGSKAVRFYRQYVGPKAVFKFPSPEDLSLGGRLHFALFVECLNVDSPNATSLEIRFYTDENDYFVKDLGISGGKRWKAYSWAGVAPKNYKLNWSEIGVGFNLYDPEGYAEVNNPSWKSISSISIELKYPYGDHNYMIIDDFYFTDFEVRASASDSLSISKYGLRAGPALRDGNIRNTLEAQVVADALLNLYKNPTKFVADVEVEDIFNLPLGYEATIELYGEKVVATVRELRYEFDGKMLRETADFGERYLPKIEYIFQDAIALLRAANWNVELFRKMFADMAIIDVGAELIDFGRVAFDLPMDIWLRIPRVVRFPESRDALTIDSSGIVPINEVCKPFFGGCVDLINITDSDIWYEIRSTDNLLDWSKTIVCTSRVNFGTNNSYWAIGVGQEQNMLWWSWARGESLAFTYQRDWTSEQTIFLFGPIDPDVWYDLEIRYYPGDVSTIELYVNHVLRTIVTYSFNPITTCVFNVYSHSGYDEPDTLHILDYRVGIR